MANPIATSAAATAIENKTNTWPEMSEWYTEKAVNNKLPAANINSKDINKTIVLLLYNTPKIPIENSKNERYT